MNSRIKRNQNSRAFEKCRITKNNLFFQPYGLPYGCRKGGKNSHHAGTDPVGMTGVERVFYFIEKFHCKNNSECFFSNKIE